MQYKSYSLSYSLEFSDGLDISLVISSVVSSCLLVFGKYPEYVVVLQFCVSVLDLSLSKLLLRQDSRVLHG